MNYLSRRIKAQKAYIEKQIAANLCMFFLIIFVAANCSEKDESSVFKSPYLGLKPPGMKAEIFAPGIVSTEADAEYGGHFSPDMKEFYFSRHSPGNPGQLWITMRDDNRWSPPRVTGFMKEFPGIESCISPDGSRFYYVWYDPQSEDFVHDFYVIERAADGWGSPRKLTETDLGTRRISPSVASSGNLYFSGDFDEPGQKDIYVSRLIDSQHAAPLNLGLKVNSRHHEEHVYVSADESFILFDSYRPGGHGNSDIYISFKNDDGSWSDAQNLGPAVNSAHYDWYPYVTPDGQYIIFARTLPSAVIDLYWVEAKFVENMRSENAGTEKLAP